MYHILILDDEEPLREAIRILGEWDNLKISEIYEAINGQEGLSILREHHIDLIMVDMKMPGMNGVEFLKKVKQEYPDMLTIVISGYNDFEYTHQAIRSNVLDYLLKPVNRHELNDTLRKAVHLLQERQQQHQQKIQQHRALHVSLPKLKENIYQSLIDKRFKKQGNEDMLAMIGAEDDTCYHGAVVLRILNIEQVRRQRFYGDTSLLYFAIANVLNECTEDDIQYFCFANQRLEREMILVYHARHRYPQELGFAVQQRVRSLIQTLEHLLDLYIIAGSGTPSNDIQQLATAYEQGKHMIEQMNILELNRSMIIPYEQRNAIAESHSLCSRMPQIRTLLENGHFPQIHRIADELIAMIKQSPYLSMHMAEYSLHDFEGQLYEITRELDQRLLADDSAITNARKERIQIHTLDMMNIAQWEQHVHDIITYYAEMVRKSGGSRQSFHISDIRAYIDQHYFEEIKISMFTDKYYLSREYLMKLFKQEYQMGIHEYVQQLRMDKAKTLLNEEGLKIQEISEMLGYKDKNYFSKAFRNYYQLSPSEYRAQRSAISNK
ncbi:response regulator [Paenibacillus kyungheensis]|uniref:Response regulator n=1 Tax=Paenibacillus kyungheensis TaxID=1452732 RepID=A0AAX3LVS2_9BACL|nr:response regulator [Paenibacillus kyungheensis]WCT54047.1 response regulator [Paenibacillus kyungheensis]